MSQHTVIVTAQATRTVRIPVTVEAASPTSAEDVARAVARALLASGGADCAEVVDDQTGGWSVTSARLEQ